MAEPPPPGPGRLLPPEHGGGDPELIWPFPGENRDEWSEGPRLSDDPLDRRWTVPLCHAGLQDRWERGLVRYDVERRQAEILVWTPMSMGVGTSLTTDPGSYSVVSDGDRPDELWTANGDFSDDRALTDMNPWLSDVALSREQTHRIPGCGRGRTLWDSRCPPRIRGGHGGSAGRRDLRDLLQ